MTKNLSFFALGLIALIFSVAIFAHDGSHDTARLPPYEQNQQKSSASLRITEVSGHYIVAFFSSQYNFLKNDDQDLKDEKLLKQRDKLLEQLKNPSSLFNVEDFDCQSVMVPNVDNHQKIRLRDPKMSGEYVKTSEQTKHTEFYSHISGQYKLSCKKPLESQKIAVRAFVLAPYLETLLVAYKTNNEGDLQLSLKKPATSLRDATKIVPAALPKASQAPLKPENKLKVEQIPAASEKSTERKPVRELK